MMRRILYLGLDPSNFCHEGSLTHWPIIRIDPRPISDTNILNALNHFNQYSHFIFTSKSAAALLYLYLDELKINHDIWRDKITIVVGSATATYLQKQGMTQLIIAKEETAEGVLRILEKLFLGDAYLFWPHSFQARPLIAQYLIEKKISHVACALYDVRNNIPSRPLPNLREFDEIVFTSPSTVKAFISVFGSLPMHVILTPIGPITAQSLENFKKNGPL